MEKTNIVLAAPAKLELDGESLTVVTEVKYLE